MASWSLRTSRPTMIPSLPGGGAPFYLALLGERSTPKREGRSANRVDARGREAAERTMEHVDDLVPKDASIERERGDRGGNRRVEDAAEVDTRSPGRLPFLDPARNVRANGDEPHRHDVSIAAP